MAGERKPFLIRLDKELLNALQRWADDELRSLNGQIDFILRQALKEAGRSPKGSALTRTGDSPHLSQEPSSSEKDEI